MSVSYSVIQQQRAAAHFITPKITISLSRPLTPIILPAGKTGKHRRAVSVSGGPITLCSSPFNNGLKNSRYINPTFNSRRMSVFFF